MLEHDLTIGTELEFEIPKHGAFNKHSAYLYVRGEALKWKKCKTNDYGIIKYDGTIKFGFEYASKPLMASTFLNSQKTFKNIFLFFKKNKVSIDNHLGMHIHVAKGFLSQNDIFKLNHFIFRNSKFCNMVGGRKPNKYCRAKENEGEDLEINLKSPKFSGDYRYNNDVNSKYNHKHRMLNVARPKTIEFRFFKSTNDFKMFYKNMQFIIALVNFVKSTKLDVEDFRVGGETMLCMDENEIIYDEEEGLDFLVDKFCNYVKQHKSTYEYLYRFLAQRKFIKK